MRPIYETIQNREAELKVFKHIQRLFPNARWERKERLSQVDFVGEYPDGKSQTIEIKCRGDNWNYPTYMISCHKLLNLIERSKNGYGWLVIGLKDVILYHRVRSPEYYEHTKQKGGRVDRGDPKDIEDCFFIPIDQFSRYQPKPTQQELL